MTHKFPRISLHPTAPAGLFLLFFAVPRMYMFSVLSSVLLHELGHLAAATLFHKKIKELRIMPSGISILLPNASSYREEILVAAAGPLMNLLYLAVSFRFPSKLAETAGTVSLLLGGLNLLPLEGFDGGRILSALIAYALGEEAADRFLQITTALCLSVLWIFSLYIFFYSGINMTLLLFCAYLFSFLFLKKGENRLPHI